MKGRLPCVRLFAHGDAPRCTVARAKGIVDGSIQLWWRNVVRRSEGVHANLCGVIGTRQAVVRSLILKGFYARDASHFRKHVAGFLAAHEAANNLLFGILAGIVDGVFNFSIDPPLLASVESDGSTQLVALRTPPLNLVLSTAVTDAAVIHLARELHAAGHALPGVTAPEREAERFARTWSALTGAGIARDHSQRIYELARIIPPARVPPGHLHQCTEADLALATEWIGGFNRDVGQHQVPANARRYIGPPDSGLVFWVDGEPVSMAGYSGPTPSGIRVAAVYTPPALRGRGYASACVAALSRQLLDAGRKRCFLYTDLANPTSNHIYSAIGYQPVCDALVLKFED